jgi:hypothetical protein
VRGDVDGDDGAAAADEGAGGAVGGEIFWRMAGSAMLGAVVVPLLFGLMRGLERRAGHVGGPRLMARDRFIPEVHVWRLLLLWLAMLGLFGALSHRLWNLQVSQGMEYQRRLAKQSLRSVRCRACAGASSTATACGWRTTGRAIACRSIWRNCGGRGCGSGRWTT